MPEPHIASKEQPGEGEDRVIGGHGRAAAARPAIALVERVTDRKPCPQHRHRERETLECGRRRRQLAETDEDGRECDTARAGEQRGQRASVGDGGRVSVPPVDIAHGRTYIGCPSTLQYGREWFR